MAMVAKKAVRRHTGRDHSARADLVLPTLRRSRPSGLQSSHSTDPADGERLLRQRLVAKDAGMHGEAAAGHLTVAEGLADMIADYRVNRCFPATRSAQATVDSG